jgi:hypothetical protein
VVEYSRNASKPIYPTRASIGQQALALLVFVSPCIVLNVLGVMAVRHGAGRFVGLPWHLAALGTLIAALPLCITVLPFWLVRRLRPRLLAKVKVVYGEQPPEAPMVGFSPGSSIRLYSGDTAKDFGLLVVSPGAMRYLGDTITFQLSPQQVENVSLVEQAIWTQPVPRVLIGWRERPDTEIQGFTLEVWDASTLWQSRAAAAALANSIETWRRGDIA